ncbi:hypothetical protein SAY86_022627 [Trapa natans]|uniref:Cation/H+ exchanger domain-containing protein n=1 Tax=Trapa natans TaxID=22666 RepID=A0AAN7LTT4_TRANT|nr:hypothetical protein SAY86_022627 [Trapa natans]
MGSVLVDPTKLSELNLTLIPGQLDFIRINNGPMVCAPSSNGVSRGVFFNENPLKESFNVFILQVILLSVAYKIVHHFLRPLKQTSFVCSVLAGVLMGPHLLGRLNIFGKAGLFPKKELIITETIGSLGIAYFIFINAVKMDVAMLWRSAKKSTIIGSMSVLLTWSLNCVALTVMRNPDIRPGFFILLFCSGVSVTRFANLASALDEMDILTSRHSQMALSASMLSELFTWMSLICGIIYRQYSKNPVIPAWLLLTVVAIFAVGVFLRCLAKRIITRLNESGLVYVSEALITSILVLALLMAFVTDLVGSLHLGILVMGLVIPDGPPLGSAIVERSEYMVKEFLMPLFYVMVGYTTDFTSIPFLEMWWIALFVIMGAGTKFVFTLLGAMAVRQDFRTALLHAVMSNIKGPMDLYLFMRWKNHKDVGARTHAILVLSHVFGTAITIPLTEILHDACRKWDMSDRRSIKAIQTSANDREFKVLCCVHSKENIPGLISILEASKGSPSSSILSAVIVHLNDLVGRAAPLKLRNDKLERKVETNESDAVAHEFESFIRKWDDPIELTNYIVVAPYRTMHESVCDLAQKEMTTLILLPHRTSALAAAASAAMNNLNCGVLGQNPCAVGIFVNKGLGRSLGHDTFSSDVRVAVIFSGGHDDREALAYAIRMLLHPAVHVTLLRLIVRCPNEYVEDMLERKRDESLIKEFWMKVKENPKTAGYYEEAAVDTMSTLNAVRTLGDSYNLVLTGRESTVISSIFEETIGTMKLWGDNPELGIIGDFVASDDFNEGKSSALIMHRYPCRATALSRKRSQDYDGDYLLG